MDAPPALRLGLVGDCMWMRDSWTSFMSDRTRSALESCDAVIGNLETPLHARLRQRETAYTPGAV